MAHPLLPSTAFKDAWIRVDQTEDPRFFVNLPDATRARLLERARTSPDGFFAPLRLHPGLNVLDVGCGTGDFLRLLAPIVAPGMAVGVDLSETMIAEACQRSAEKVDTQNDGERGQDNQIAKGKSRGECGRSGERYNAPPSRKKILT